jgi:hypothetical protein
MRGFTFLVLAAVAGLGFSTSTPKAEAQVSVEIGAAPDCPYGYYDAAPYGCAPTGYYGPEWFNASDFQGNVNNRLHPEHGYNGPTPQRGEKAESAKRVDSAHFQGNEVRDGRGHVGKK